MEGEENRSPARHGKPCGGGLSTGTGPARAVLTVPAGGIYWLMGAL